MNIERQYIGARYVPILGGEWNPQASYQALTIVTHLNSSYTSRKPVPPGIAITNDEYWVLTGNFNGQVEEIRQLAVSAQETADAANTSAGNLAADVEEIKEKTGNLIFNNVVSSFRYYIDGVNGNDNNPGTQERPFKTVGKFFRLANQVNGGRSDLRAYLMTAGTYAFQMSDTGNLVFNSIAFHLTGLTDGCIIQFNSTSDIKFYNCHCNFSNITFSTPGSNMSLDGSFLAITNCVFTEGVIVYSSLGFINACTMPTIAIKTSVISINAIHITNTSPTQIAISFYESDIVLRGALTIDSLAKAGTTAESNYVECVRSRVILRSTPPVVENPYYYLLAAFSSIITIPQSAYDAFKTRSGAGAIAPNRNETSLFIGQGTKENAAINIVL